MTMSEQNFLKMPRRTCLSIALFNIFVHVNSFANTINSTTSTNLMLKSEVREDKIQNVEKLKPQIRELPNNKSTHITSLNKLRNLLSKPCIMESSTFNNAPQLIAGPDGQTMYSLGDTIYATNFTGQTGDIVSLFSPIKIIYDPDSGEDLGLSVRYNGVAVVDAVGEIATLHIVAMYKQIGRGDKVLLMLNTDNNDFNLKYSKTTITGKVVAMDDDATFTAEDNTVAINRGANDGVEVGQIMRIYSNRNVANSSTLMDNDVPNSQAIQLPAKLIGEMIVYKVYPKVSFGLVTDSISPIYLNAMVQSEQQ